MGSTDATGKFAGVHEVIWRRAAHFFEPWNLCVLTSYDKVGMSGTFDDGCPILRVQTDPSQGVFLCIRYFSGRVRFHHGIDRCVSGLKRRCARGPPRNLRKIPPGRLCRSERGTHGGTSAHPCMLLAEPFAKDEAASPLRKKK